LPEILHCPKIISIPIDISLFFEYSSNGLRERAQDTKSCAREGDPEGEAMKKIIVIATLVLALTSVALVADPITSTFDVQTTIQGINKMKITTAKYTSTVPANFDSATAFQGPLGITTSGTQTFNAWLSTMSNNRKGYTVSMSATAMKSSITGQADSYINYTVTVNNKSITTNKATPVQAVDVITINSLSTLGVQSHKIALSVDQGTFDAAVQGQYSGTVTFTYTSNT